MNNRKIWFLIIACAIVISFFLFLAIKSVNFSKSSDEYQIGVVLSLTGRGATYGNRALHGMQLAADELNTTEAFRYKPIRLIVEDSQSEAPQALSALRKLIDINNIFVSVGFVLSDEVLTCAPIANQEKVVLLTTAAGSDKIKDAGDFIFRNRESAFVQCEAIAKAVVQRFNFKDIAVIYSNSANGISYRNAFVDAVNTFGGNITSEVGYNEGKTEYKAEIEQLRAKAPKAVFLAGLDNELGLIVRQSREVEFSPQFFATAGAISQKLLEVAGSAAEGLICGSAPFDLQSKDPHVESFSNSYEKRYDENPDFIAANSYDAIYIVAELFKNGATNGETIRDGLYKTTNFHGVGGLTTFDHYGEVNKPINLVIVKNGEFKELEDR